MSIYLYCRVSTGAQFRDGHSIKSQAQSCKTFSKTILDTLGEATNCDEPGLFVDESSAYKIPLSHRPGGFRLLKAIKPGDTVVMYDIVRGWRNLGDFASNLTKWIDYGVGLRFVAYPSLDLSTANGRLTASVIAAYAEWKSAISSERQKEFYAARSRGLIEESSRTPSRKATNSRETQVLSEMLRPVPAELPEDVPKPSMNMVYGYIRVSTDKQSLESQYKPVEDYMWDVMDGYVLPGEIFQDKGVSALTTPFNERPGSCRLMGQLKHGDHVVFLRPARAFRSVKDMVATVELLHEMGVTIHLAEGGMKSGDMNFQMTMQIMVMMAQIESEENSRRVRDVNAWMWEHGLVPRNSTTLPRWLKAVSIDGKYRHIIPDEEYLMDCRFCVKRMEEGKPVHDICKEMEEFVAMNECRPPVNVTGSSPSKVRYQLYRDYGSSPFHQVKQEAFLQRLEQAEKANKLIQPFYTKWAVKLMKGHLQAYERYCELLDEGGVERVAESIHEPTQEAVQVADGD